MPITWFDGIPITVEAGLSSATGTYGTWDSSLWNTGTWGPDTVWTDISPWVKSIETRRRFERDLQAWASGEGTIVLKNDDGRFSPANLSGPYVVGGVTGIRPWRPIRIKVAGNPIYTGYALAWNEVYARGHADRERHRPVPRRVRVARPDQRVRDLSPRRRRAIGSADPPDPQQRRPHRRAGGRRRPVPMQATTLAQNTVAELKLTADSEGGAVWVEADGAIWFQNRYALLENSRSNSITATFGDGSGNELPCVDVEVDTDEDRLVNLVSFARDGGTAKVVGDATSRALYGDKTYQRHDLITVADGEVAGLAELYVAAHKDAELRVKSLTFAPRTPARISCCCSCSPCRHGSGT